MGYDKDVFAMRPLPGQSPDLLNCRATRFITWEKTWRIAGPSMRDLCCRSQTLVQEYLQDLADHHCSRAQPFGGGGKGPEAQLGASQDPLETGKHEQ